MAQGTLLGTPGWADLWPGISEWKTRVLPGDGVKAQSRAKSVGGYGHRELYKPLNPFFPLCTQQEIWVLLPRHESCGVTENSGIQDSCRHGNVTADLLSLQHPVMYSPGRVGARGLRSWRGRVVPEAANCREEPATTPKVLFGEGGMIRVGPACYCHSACWQLCSGELQELQGCVCRCPQCPVAPSAAVVEPACCGVEGRSRQLRKGWFKCCHQLGEEFTCSAVSGPAYIE